MRPVTVTQVNEYIAKKLKGDYNLQGLAVEGEISGLSKSGQHVYLTLKDEGSLIKCAIWASNLRNIDSNIIKNGQKLIAIADISPYVRGGNYSLSIRMAEPAGEGALMAEFNRVKNLLQSEGLFDSKYKKPLPEFPLCVGVITSDTGAAIEDIKKIITGKNNLTDIIIFPTQVQGIGAEKSIIRNIELANEASEKGIHIDTLIVGRGGGASEDLMAFNDEGVARAIFASRIPIISAVGHESDVSISDFVADRRAETPTAAADMAVMNTFELKDEIDYNYELLNKSIRVKIDNEKQMIQNTFGLMLANIKAKLAQTRLSLEKAQITISENNPENVFSKGYAAVLDDGGKTISDINNINIDDEYDIRISNGSFRAKVISKE